MRDQRRFHLVKPRRQLADVGVGDVERFALVGDQQRQVFALGGVIGIVDGAAPALDARLQFSKALVEPGLCQRRGEIAHQRRARAALGQHPFGRVVGGVEVEIGRVADQPVRPALARHPRLLARHEFQRAMGAEMEDRMRAEIFADPAVEGTEGVGRREGAFEQQPHRVAFVAEGGLHADKHITELRALDEDVAAIGQLLARGGAPGGFDLGEVLLAPDVIIGRNAHGDVGIGAIAIRIALEQRVAHRIKAFGNIDGVTFAREPLQGRIERFMHRHEGCGAGRPGIGREVEHHDGELAAGAFAAAKLDQFDGAGGQRFGAFRASLHRTGVVRSWAAALAITAMAAFGRATGPSAEHARDSRAIELGHGDHHGGFKRQQPLRTQRPFLDRLELDRVGGEVGQVELAQNLARGLRIAIGRAADQRKAGEVDDGIHGGLAITVDKEGFDCRACIKPAGEHRHDLEPGGFEGSNRAVIMRAVAAQQIGTQQDQPDRALAALFAR